MHGAQQLSTFGLNKAPSVTGEITHWVYVPTGKYFLGLE